MASKHILECDNKCSFEAEQGGYLPFYVIDGEKEYARTPVPYEETKKIAGYTDTEYCTVCNKSVYIDYLYKPYNEPRTAFFRFLKEAIYILRMAGGRKYLGPPPACPTCKTRSFLSIGDSCPKCKTGTIKRSLLWIS